MPSEEFIHWSREAGRSETRARADRQAEEEKALRDHQNAVATFWLEYKQMVRRVVIPVFEAITIGFQREDVKIVKSRSTGSEVSLQFAESSLRVRPVEGNREVAVVSSDEDGGGGRGSYPPQGLTIEEFEPIVQRFVEKRMVDGA